jgi:hypothetical protein
MIYIIANAETDDLKIGYSTNPKKRLKELQTGNANELLLMLQFKGTFEDEKKLHETFKHLRLEGEWFKGQEIMNIYETLEAISKDNKYVYYDLLSFENKTDALILRKFIYKYGFKKSVMIKKEIDSILEELKISQKEYEESLKRLEETDMLKTKNCVMFLNPYYDIDLSMIDRIIEYKKYYDLKLT